MERDPQATGEQWLPPQPPGPAAPPQPAPQPHAPHPQSHAPEQHAPAREDTPASTPQPPPAQPYGYPPAYGPPPWQQQYGYQQYGYGQGPGQIRPGIPPPGYPPPGYGPGPWGQPYGYGYPQPWQGPPAPREPNNDPAIAGLSLSLCGLGLLFLSMGLSSAIVSPAAGAFGIWFGRRGMQKVDKGETRRYRSAGKAGVVLGIITIVLSLIALAIWIAIIASDPEFLEDPDESDFDGGSAARAGVALAVRAAASIAA